MIKVFYWIDTEKIDILYVFPTDIMANTWSVGRFKQAMLSSPKLRNMFTQTDNVTHKIAGYTNFYCRGSNSPSKLESLPVSGLVFDELDRMHTPANASELGSNKGAFDAVALGRARLNAAVKPRELDIGTPTIFNFGVSREYEKSDKKEWHIICPKCSRIESLQFPDNVVWIEGKPKTAKYRCKQCKQTFSQKDMLAAGGLWVPLGDPEALVSGYKLSGLYSPVMPLWEIIKTYEDSLNDVYKLQTFYNNYLGEPYTNSSICISSELVEKAKNKFRNGEKYETPTVMGVDVGTLLHIDISYFDENNVKHTLYLGTRKSFDELEELYNQYNVSMAVIDYFPETREVHRFCLNHSYGAYGCRYVATHDASITVDDTKMCLVVNRTVVIDELFSMFRSYKVRIPYDSPPEYANHLTALKRIVETKSNGTDMARYVHSDDDHYTHASVYCMLANKILATSGIDMVEYNDSGFYI